VQTSKEVTRELSSAYMNKSTHRIRGQQSGTTGAVENILILFELERECQIKDTPAPIALSMQVQYSVDHGLLQDTSRCEFSSFFSPSFE